MSWEIRRYLDGGGGNPVEEFIVGLPEKEEALVRARITFLEEVGSGIREPHSKNIGEGLFELRVKSRRILYCFKPGRVIVLLHAFTKKTQKIPGREIQVARKRKEEVEDES